MAFIVLGEESELMKDNKVHSFHNLQYLRATTSIFSRSDDLLDPGNNQNPMPKRVTSLDQTLVPLELANLHYSCALTT
jgi:hypothetical protein